jgi:hypothetical protein
LAQGLLRREEKMERGDKITFPFGKGEKEGTVFKVFPKTVYIKVDFEKQKGKIVKRSIVELQPTKEAKKTQEEKKWGVKKKEAKKKEKEKKKIKAAKEGRKKEKAAQKSTQ